MIGLLLVALGIWGLVRNHSNKNNNPCYIGQIIDIGQKPLSYGKYGTRNPLIVRILLNNQPIITSTLSTVTCYWLSSNAIESKKREHVGKIVHIYFNHAEPWKSVVKEYEGGNVAAGIILIVVGALTCLGEMMIVLLILFSIIFRV